VQNADKKFRCKMQIRNSSAKSRYIKTIIIKTKIEEDKVISSS
jgi:hypothetical protein